jgi:hypothetical protein
VGVALAACCASCCRCQATCCQAMRACFTGRDGQASLRLDYCLVSPSSAHRCGTLPRLLLPCGDRTARPFPAWQRQQSVDKNSFGVTSTQTMPQPDLSATCTARARPAERSSALRPVLEPSCHPLSICVSIKGVPRLAYCPRHPVACLPVRMPPLPLLFLRSAHRRQT